MEINEFFQTANNLMSELVQVDPSLLQKPESTFCILETESGNIYGGVSSIKVVNGKIQSCCAEYNAMMSVIPNSDSHIKQMATMYFSNHNVITPCQECLYLLFRVDKANKSTNIFISKNEAVNAQGMLLSNTISQHDPTAAAAAMNVDEAVKLPFEVPEEEQPKDISDFDEAFEPDVPKDTDVTPSIDEFMNGFSDDASNPFIEANNQQAKTIPGAPQPFPQSMQVPTMNGMQQPVNGYPPQSRQMPPYGNSMQPQMPMNGMYGQQPMNGYPQQMQIPQYGNPMQQQMNGMYGQQPVNGYPQQMQMPPYGNPMQPPMNGMQQTGYFGTQQQFAANPGMPMSRPFVSKQYSVNSAQISQHMSSQAGDNGQSVFKQRLTDFLKIDGEQPEAEPEVDKDEMLRQQREKKKMAKLDADYKKRMKK